MGMTEKDFAEKIGSELQHTYQEKAEKINGQMKHPTIGITNF